MLEAVLEVLHEDTRWGLGKLGTKRAYIRS